LKATARKPLKTVAAKYKLQDSAAALLGGTSRVSHCCRTMMKHESHVQIIQHKGGSLSYGNLVKCGSVWVCPVCASKISTGRRDELGELIGRSMAVETSIGPKRPFLVGMLTLTVPHVVGDDLKDMLKRMCDAKRKMQNRKDWKRFAVETGLAGEVRTLEVTHGSAGWHPHLHLLLFFSDYTRVSNIKRRVLAMWSKACCSVGLGIPNNFGVSFTTAQKDVAGYIAKFGIDAEMTQGHLKEGHKALSRSPFRLLADYQDGDKQAGALFVEYAEAFKGKRQLVYSKGLRHMFGLVTEKTDDELLNDSDGAKVVYVLTKEQWITICSQKKRGRFLENFSRYLLSRGAGPMVSDEEWYKPPA
jgi:Replication protein